MSSTPRTRVGARRLVALVALACLATGCQAAADGGSTSRAAQEGTTEGPGSHSSPTSGKPLKTYVALGDSYTAAPLLRPIEEVHGCLRSPNNYPARLAEEHDLDLVDVSCSGASTNQMLIAQAFAAGGRTRPPQFDALSKDTDLVTVGIGANDFRFFGRMIVDCIAMAPDDPDGSPCESKNIVAPAPQRIEDKLDVITKHVAEVAEGIRKRSPHARILIVGYPQLVPPAGTCKNLPLAKGDYGFVRRLNLSLADAVREGALTSDAEYVDLLEASQGHDICSEKPWIAGVLGPKEEPLSLHPYRREQRAVAVLISRML